MKSRAPLALMEAIIMLAVFALAAALCLQAFVKSDQTSRENEAMDRAAVVCQSAAETLRHNGGDLAGAVSRMAGGAGERPLPYTENWELCPRNGDGSFDVTDAAYYLRLEEVPSGVEGLGKARVWVTDRDDATLFELEAVWQREVTDVGA